MFVLCRAWCKELLLRRKGWLLTRRRRCRCCCWRLPVTLTPHHPRADPARGGGRPAVPAPQRRAARRPDGRQRAADGLGQGHARLHRQGGWGWVGVWGPRGATHEGVGVRARPLHTHTRVFAHTEHICAHTLNMHMHQTHTQPPHTQTAPSIPPPGGGLWAEPRVQRRLPAHPHPGLRRVHVSARACVCGECLRVCARIVSTSSPATSPPGPSPPSSHHPP